MSVKKKVKIELDEDIEKIIDFPMKKTEIEMEKKTDVQTERKMDVQVDKPEMHVEKKMGIQMDQAEREILMEQMERNMLLEKSEKEEEPEFEYNFFVCCWRRPILESARTVSFLSAVSLVVNIISLIFAGSRTSLHLAIEVFLLILEFFSLLLLFYALSHRVPKYMKPYMVFGVLWNIFLTLLWLFCFAELLKGAQFQFKVSSTLSEILSSSYRRRHVRNGFLTTFLMLFALGTTIAVNFWILHIIVLAYFYLKQKRGKHSSSWNSAFIVSTPGSPSSRKTAFQNSPTFL